MQENKAPRVSKLMWAQSQFSYSLCLNHSNQYVNRSSTCTVLAQNDLLLQ